MATEGGPTEDTVCGLDVAAKEQATPLSLTRSEPRSINGLRIKRGVNAMTSEGR